MQLLFVIDHLSSGGAQGQMSLLAYELVKRGHQVEFFLYQHETFHRDRLDQANIKIHHHPKRSRFSLKTIFDLKRVIRESRPELMLAFLTTPNTYSILSRGFRRSPALIISERSSSNNPRQVGAGWIRKFLNAWLYRRADHLCVNSYHLKEALSRAQGWSDERISTIWNGVDLEHFSHLPLPTSDPERFLAIGRIAEYKNASCLIDALAIARDRFGFRPSVSWLARRFPNLTPDEQAHKDSLDRRMDRLGVREQWTWLPETKDVRGTLSEHSALVHTSLVEGLPNAVCESLACGRPVLISNVLDHPRLILERQNGFLFDPMQPNSLADKLVEFHQLSHDQKNEMSVRARRFAEEHLDKSKFVDQFESLMKKLIGA